MLNCQGTTARTQALAANDSRGTPVASRIATFAAIFLAGLSLGYAALLAHGALVLPTLLTGLPGGPVVDRLWLAGNAVLALWLARAISRK